MVHHLVERLAHLGQAALVHIVDDVLLLGLLQERDRRLEGHQVAQLGHVDAVAVRVTDLRGAAHHHDPLRFKPVQHAQDALAQRGAAHDAVIDHHEVVHPGAHGPVGDVVDVGHQVVARIIARDEGAQLGVLDGHLLAPHLGGKDGSERHGVRLGAQLQDALFLDRVQVFLQAILQAVEGHLCGIGDEGEHRVFQVMVHGIQDGGHQ